MSQGSGRPQGRVGVALLVAAALGLSACATETEAGTSDDDGAPPDTAPISEDVELFVEQDEPASATTTVPPTTTTTTSTTVPPTTTTTTTTTTTSTTTTVPAPTTTTTTLPPPPPAADPEFSATIAAFDRLAAANRGASISVARGGELVLERATGPTVVGFVAGAFTPMVVASVSKIMLATTIARLDQRGVVDVDTPMPWADLGLAPHPAWEGTTIRELLDHSAGMPVVRFEWFRGGMDCRAFLSTIIDTPPTGDRGRWRYSNGNYCALGLLVEHVTGTTAVEAVNDELFRPLGLVGAHSTDDGLQPDDMVHAKPVERLSRLGAAGTFIVSSNDLALAFANLTPADLDVLRQPAVFIDQYGFGHTGTISGAKACTWVLQDGATVMSAAIAGNSVSSGGGVCDRLLPALARDLGIPAQQPDRWP